MDSNTRELAVMTDLLTSALERWNDEAPQMWTDEAWYADARNRALSGHVSLAAELFLALAGQRGTEAACEAARTLAITCPAGLAVLTAELAHLHLDDLWEAPEADAREALATLAPDLAHDVAELRRFS